MPGTAPLMSGQITLDEALALQLVDMPAELAQSLREVGMVLSAGDPAAAVAGIDSCIDLDVF